MSKFSNYFFDMQHAGELNQNDKTVFWSEVGSEKQNNLLRLFLQYEDERIIQAKFQAFASPAMMASGEYVCCWLLGKTLHEAQELTATQIMTALEMTSLQNHIAVLVERLVKITLAKCK